MNLNKEYPRVSGTHSANVDLNTIKMVRFMTKARVK